jgi:hypothetical protein
MKVTRDYPFPGIGNSVFQCLFQDWFSWHWMIWFARLNHKTYFFYLVRILVCHNIIIRGRWNLEYIILSTNHIHSGWLMMDFAGISWVFLLLGTMRKCCRAASLTLACLHPLPAECFQEEIISLAIRITMENICHSWWWSIALSANWSCRLRRRHDIEFPKFKLSARGHLGEILWCKRILFGPFN